jgi:hypothetical protein
MHNCLNRNDISYSTKSPFVAHALTKAFQHRFRPILQSPETANSQTLLQKC